MTMNSVNNGFCEIFDKIVGEYDELSELVQAVEIMSDHKLYTHYLKQIKNIEEIAKKYKEYKQIVSDIAAINDLRNSDNFAECDLEVKNLELEKEGLFEKLKALYAESKSKENEQVEIEISSKDDMDFVLLLKEVFMTYSNRCGFELVENLSKSDAEFLKIAGEDVFKQLKIFSGKLKKVFRGNETFANVVVLKTDDEKIVINEDDLVVQTSKSGGAGGQHINKTESAVKIIHLPTGIFAECQDERSQLKNKEKAMQALLKKLEQQTKDKCEKSIKNQRKEISGKLFSTTPEMIFDFDANKVILNENKTDYKLKEIVSGNLELIINNQVN